MFLIQGNDKYCTKIITRSYKKLKSKNNNHAQWS